jgi:hypothetical protein
MNRECRNSCQGTPQLTEISCFRLAIFPPKESHIYTPAKLALGEQSRQYGAVAIHSRVKFATSDLNRIAYEGG